MIQEKFSLKEKDLLDRSKTFNDILVNPQNEATDLKFTNLMPDADSASDRKTPTWTSNPPLGDSAVNFFTKFNDSSLPHRSYDGDKLSLYGLYPGN